MFYCELCREIRNWPESMIRSRGRCEICGLTASCYDVPSSALPVYRSVESEIHQTVDTSSEVLGALKILRKRVDALQARHHFLKDAEGRTVYPSTHVKVSTDSWDELMDAIGEIERIEAGE